VIVQGVQKVKGGMAVELLAAGPAAESS